MQRTGSNHLARESNKCPAQLRATAATWRLRTTISSWWCAMLVMLTLMHSGCGRAKSKPEPPRRYGTIEKLRTRLEQVAQYGDGGSSLGGIPESIDELMKTDRARAGKLLEKFQKLNTATEKDERKKIAKEMAEDLK